MKIEQSRKPNGDEQKVFVSEDQVFMGMVYAATLVFLTGWSLLTHEYTVLILFGYASLLELVYTLDKYFKKYNVWKALFLVFLFLYLYPAYVGQLVRDVFMKSAAGLSVDLMFVCTSAALLLCLHTAVRLSNKRAFDLNMRQALAFSGIPTILFGILLVYYVFRGDLSLVEKWAKATIVLPYSLTLVSYKILQTHNKISHGESSIEEEK